MAGRAPFARACALDVCARALLLGLCVALAATRCQAGATVSLAWIIRANINATITQGDTVVWEWGDSFAHTLQQTGIQDPHIFTGPGTGGCGPGNNKTQPFTYKMTVNQTGRFTYNDGCNPETTSLGILWVLPRPVKGPVPPTDVTIYNTTDTPPLWNSTTVILPPPPPAPPAAAPAPAPALAPMAAPRAFANLTVRLNSSNVTLGGLAHAPLPSGALTNLRIVENVPVVENGAAAAGRALAIVGMAALIVALLG
ncbi:hypothetical protein KFL_000870080 [Klebsormidium nitens]|uniref:Phytocyanin domain-containing protein n=1 Tax=Klebsormidium nitens TaxID=105231 RepID=A0A1Y1HU65_KLENI|nr:hypothetical protein KFL_000870080 [Klebsormidium nitens]|eukprot:GAQ81673.1 hypothetical protein KFL_000870080 [Klebsormidium nitens]